MAEGIGSLSIGDHVLSFDPSHVDDRFKEIAERELRETPEVREAALARLRQLIEDVKDFKFLPEGAEADAILLRFLRPCKFYPESALEKMKHYFAFKYNNPSLNEDLLCEGDRKVFNKGLFTILPVRDQHGRRIAIIESGAKWVPREVTLTELIRGVVIGTEAASFSQNNQIAGGMIIVNCEGLSWTHLMQYTPRIATTALHYVQECLPFRIKAIHIINQAYIFTLIYAIFKPFINEKLRHRIHFHGKNWTSLLKHIDARALPTRFGGDLEIPELPENKLFDFFASYKKYYEDIAALGYTRKPTSRC